MNKKIVIHVLGLSLVLESACMLLPLICSLIYRESDAFAFAVSAAICFVSGFLLKSIVPKKRNMYAKEGLAAVSLSWICMSLFGALPFIISGAIPNFFDALFETVSGFTTTGASILKDVEKLSHGMLFWRSFTHWIGGMGVLVFLVSLLKLSGGDNLYLLKAESTGPAVGKIVPRVQSSAKILYAMYTFFTILEILLLLIGGMPLFDSITISLGTAGTGGFAVRNSGMAGYTAFQQNVVTVFMILFGIDFSLYYLLLMRKFKAVFKSEELRGYLGVILASIILICINISGLFDNIWTALKHSAFQVASIITTTGYATTDFDKWPEFSKTILLLLMFIGACAGSTGGGMKVSRIIIAFKTVIKELKITVHPQSTHKITINRQLVAHETIRAVNVYMVAYFVIFAFSLLLVSMDKFDFATNFSAIAATINNIGPGFARVGPTCNFGDYSSFSKIVFIFNMLVGRLEIFPMLILFSPYTWKK
ncbi:MAG: TrkH family potassium uptake protein [Clostridia bacterium]|nr:TrkH family potassium uptake protein [Clostridia bacterium]